MTHSSPLFTTTKPQPQAPSSTNQSQTTIPLRKCLLAGSLSSLLIFSATATPLMAKGFVSEGISSEIKKVEYTHHLKSELLKNSNISEAEANLLTKEVEQFLTAETAQWTPAEKSALKEILALELEASYLKELSTMSDSNLQKQLNSDPALKKISNKLPSDSEFSKFIGAALLAGYLSNIAKAFAVGVLNGTIRSGNMNFGTLFSALGRGDMRSFTNNLSRAFPAAPTFVNAMTSGAAFACDSASFGVGSGGFCSRFSGFVRSLFNRFLKSNKSGNYIAPKSLTPMTDVYRADPSK